MQNTQTVGTFVKGRVQKHRRYLRNSSKEKKNERARRKLSMNAHKRKTMYFLNLKCTNCTRRR